MPKNPHVTRSRGHQGEAMPSPWKALGGMGVDAFVTFLVLSQSGLSTGPLFVMNWTKEAVTGIGGTRGAHRAPFGDRVPSRHSSCAASKVGPWLGSHFGEVIPLEPSFGGISG